MLRSVLPLFVAAAVILLGARESSAQGRSTGGGLGSTSGSAFGGGSSFGGGGLGTSSFGGSSFGSGSGSSALGGSSFGQSAAGGSTFGSSTAGQNANQGFVGRGAADLEAFFGNLNQQAQASQRQQRAGRAGGGDSSSSSGRRPEVRVTLTASPELRRVVAKSRAPMASTTSTVSRLLARKGVTGVAVTTDAGVATLTGSVASESDRLVAEKLAAIEPGVRRVDNRLVVVPEAEEIFPE